MNVKVIQSFGDKSNFTVKYEVGAVVEFDTERAEELISKGLVEEFVSEKAKAKAEAEAEAKLAAELEAAKAEEKAKAKK